MQKFALPGSKAFATYIDYIDRDEASRNYKWKEYSGYADYMANPEKTTELFSAVSDSLSENDKQSLKEAFSFAQDNGSILWQTVYSFDNRWLEENGLLDAETNNLNVKKLQEYTRASMKKMLAKENIDNALWSAAIHYNTDNIHIHVASVELQPTRNRGVWKQKSIDTGRSSFANQVLSQSLENQKINEIIRKKMIGGLRTGPALHLQEDKELQKAFLDLVHSLPPDKRLWKYNNNAMKDYRPQIDNISKMFIEKYYKDDFKELEDLLQKQQDIYEKTYGKPKDSARRNAYKENKIQDLYARMGNSILSSCRQYDNQQTIEKIQLHQQNRAKVKEKNSVQHGKAAAKLKTQRNAAIALYELKKTLRKDLESEKNQAVYERLQRETDRERN